MHDAPGVKSFQFTPCPGAPVGMADKAVRVAVRVRPLLPHEAGHSTETLTVEDNHVRLSGKSFGFDHVFGAESNQVRGPVGGRSRWLTNVSDRPECMLEVRRVCDSRGGE